MGSVGIVLLVLVVGAVVLFKGSSAKKSHSIYQEEIFSRNVHNIQVETLSADVEVVKSMGDDVKVTLTGQVSEKDRNHFSLVTKQESENLSVEVTEKHTSFGLSYRKDVTLRVEAPDGKRGSLMMKTTSGEIDVSGMEVSNTTIETTSGDVTLEDQRQKNLIIQTSSGDVLLKSVQSRNTDIHTSSGEVDGQRFDPGVARFGTSSGEINIHSQRLQGDIEAFTSSGDIYFSFEEEPDSLRVDYQSNSGDADVRLNGLDYEVREEHKVRAKKEEGQFSIRAESSSGDLLLR